MSRDEIWDNPGGYALEPANRHERTKTDALVGSIRPFAGFNQHPTNDRRTAPVTMIEFAGGPVAYYHQLSEGPLDAN